MDIAALRRRAATALALALTVLAVPFAAPVGIAEACGCGAFSPEHGGTATVPAETGLVRWAGGGYEDLYLSLQLDSDVRTGALLFPVPDRHATVSAGPQELFTVLGGLTAPRVVPAAGSGGEGAGAAPGSVTVENRQQIGPLDVVTLSATDAGSLTTWLTTHGFTAKPRLAPLAQAYVDRGWAFVAVRLRPAASPRLDGVLDPLHLRFRVDRPIYPMRLSHLAAEPEQVTVYTLAAHRMALTTAEPGMRPVFADRLAGAQNSVLTPVLARGTSFLTRYDGTLAPASITDDFHFTPSSTDARLRPAPIREGGADRVGGDRPSASGRGPSAAVIALGALGGTLAVGLVVALVLMLRRRSAAAR